MPLHIDPEWEYWEPDEEIAEILAESGACRHPFDLLSDNRLYKTGYLGLRYGNGNPDTCNFRLAPERVNQRELVGKKECKKCGEVFYPDRFSRMYCSNECYPRPGKARVLADKSCAFCGETFRPKEASRRYCSLACVGKSQRKGNVAVTNLKTRERKEDETVGEKRR